MIVNFELRNSNWQEEQMESSDRAKPVIRKTRFLFLFPLEFCLMTLKFAIRSTKSAILVCTMLLAVSFRADAREAPKQWRIGYLSPVSSSRDSTRREAFLRGLREHGYIRGQNLMIEYRFADGNLDRQNKLAAELVRLNVDVIIAGGGTPTARAAKNATTPFLL
jgi:ABC-type uncharacterized transport system substrate-binding protein